MTSRFKATVAPVPVPSTSKGRHVDDVQAVSTASLTSSITSTQLELALLELLNIRPGSTGLANICQANPITATGKRVQLARMLGLTLIPVLLLSMISAVLFGTRVMQYNEHEKVRNTIHQGINLATLIHHLERERDISARYLSAIGSGSESRAFLVMRYPETDDALEQIQQWNIGMDRQDNIFDTKESFSNYINRHRYQLDILNMTVQGELDFYTGITEIFIQWYFDSLSEARSGDVWKQLVALQEIMRAKESLGIEGAYGTMFFIHGGFESRQDLLTFTEAHNVANYTLTEARQYSGEVSKVEEIYQATIQEDEPFMMKLAAKREIIRRTGMTRVPSNLTQANEWFKNMSNYLEALLKMQKSLIKRILQILEVTGLETRSEMGVLAVVFALVLLMCPLTLHSVYLMTSDIQNYSICLINRTKALNKEKRRTDSLLYQLLPKSVADQLKNNEEISAETFEEVSLFFSDIVGFTYISSRSSPIQVVQMLNDLYMMFDARIQQYDVFKVETIGDAYMVASGLPRRNGNRHAAEISTLALDITDHIKTKVIPHMPGTHLQLRIGIHTGAVIAGVVGKKMPRYCLFGEAVNITEKMEATAPAGHIHISQVTHARLEAIGGFVMKAQTEPLEDMDMKTFYLLHRQGMRRVGTDSQRPRSTQSNHSHNAMEVYVDDVDSADDV